MKWKKQAGKLMFFFGLYVVFTIICNILGCCMKEYSDWISFCWYFVSLIFWLATSIIWVFLIKDIL